MSCEFHLTATLEGLDKFLNQEKSVHDENESEGAKNTLSDFKISVSPSGEIIAFAKKTWLLVCGSKWDTSVTEGTKIKYSPNWHGHVNCKQGEEITSVLCLPFLSQGQSIQGCADWTCIVVGLSSGCIRFYTEAMQELACSILQEEPITDIKCQSFNTVQGKAQKQESNDVHVLYKSVICILNGSLLSQTLRTRRYQLAKGISFSSSEINGYTPLDFKKYSFDGQEEITDACFLGSTLGSLNMFDHLVTASIVNGFNSNYRISPPQTSVIVTSGRRPFVGFHYTLEGGNGPVLTDVALAVASKIKNSVAATLPDWFGFGSKKPSQSDMPKEVAQDYAEKLNCRFGLCDLWRQGQSVIVSPNGAFSAVSDSLGRVLLIDNSSGVARRMWKGYRDAQCGFFLVQEDVRKLKRSKDAGPKPQPRQGLFIVIYAPKKGLIEIFTTQHGRRVTSFKVTKYGRLLYTPRHTGSNVSASGLNLSHNQVIFISEEGLKEFMIPFHCALAEDNSKLSRDLHVLKKMKMLLKMENHSTNPKFVEEIENCAKELKMDEVRLQAIESMVTYKNTTLEAFKAVLKVFLDDFKSEDRGDSPPKKIIMFAESVLSLLLFYEFLLSLNESQETETPAETVSLSEELRLPQKELDIILKFISQIRVIEDFKKQTTKVAFEEKKSTKLGQYLSCFDFESFLSDFERNEKIQDKKEISSCRLSLKSSNKDNKYGYLGEILFKGVFSSRSCINMWRRHAESCCLNPTDLALCLLSFWCNKNLLDDFSPEVCFLVEILKVICDLNDPNVVSVEYNVESPWWSRLRSYIAINPHTIRGLFAALCCRSVTVFVEQEKELSCKRSCDKKQSTKSNEESSAISSDWETMSKDTCQWDILITQLQDVALLNAILNLSFKTQIKSQVLPEVPFDFEYQCLSSIQASGFGRVSELVAKWMVQFGFDPVVLINKSDLEFQGGAKEGGVGNCDLIENFDKVNEARSCDQNLNLALDYLALLKNRFPFSLTSSSLLGNMCWEYIAYWYKNISEVEYLKAAAKFLEIIPASGIKYGIGYLTWNTYLEKKFETLAKMINRLGKVPRGKLCFQEIGLRNDQVSMFLSLLSDYLKIILRTDVDEKLGLEPVEEVIWQNGSTASSSSLVSVALSQPVVNSDLVMFQLQLSYSLLAMAGLNIKHAKVFSSLFDNIEKSSFTLTKNTQPGSHYYTLKLKKSRTEFLQKVLTAAVQTVELVEYIPPVSYDEDVTPVSLSTHLKVDEYKNWLQLCFELAGMWAISLDDLRRHQICELYSNGFDRLAEEVIPSVNETLVLASQLLVLGGKRFKYMIQDSHDFSKKFSNLSSYLNDWLQTLDLSNFKYQCDTPDDIEVIMCYVLKWLPEGHSDQKLAIGIIESLSSMSTKVVNVDT